MAATAQIIDGASAISAAKLQAFLSLGSLLTFIVLVITNLIDYRPFYTISNPISVHDIHPLYISMFFLGWLFVYSACGANDIMMRYPAYFPDKLEVAAAGVRFITPYLTTLSIFWKLPIGWLSTYIAALERFLEMQVPWLLDKESLKYAFGGICLLIVFKVVVWLLIFYCTAPLVIFWHDLIITAIERGPSNAVELIKPTVRRQWTDSRLAANNQWRCTKLAATARLQSLKTSVKQFLRLCKPLVTFTRPTAMTEPALEEVHARLQSRNLDHHAQDNVHAALREAQDDLDGAAQEVEMLRENNDRLRRDINRVEASEARAYGARLKVDKEVERHEREIEMLNERHRQDSEDVDRLQKQIWEKDEDLARIRRERDQAREKLAIRERDLREKRASMSGRRKRKDVQERPVVAAARVKDYLKEVHLHITGYKSWVADESFVDEIFSWRRAMALLRHLVETAWFFSTVPEVTQVVRNWFDETGILVHMEDAMKVAEEKWEGYGENSMDPMKKEKKPYTATVCRILLRAIEESLKKSSDVFFNGEPIESGEGSYDDFENIVEEEINDDLQRMTELDEQGNRVDNEGNKEGVDGFVDLEELRSKLQNLDRREE